MPPISKVTNNIETWFTKELFEKIFPYAEASSVFTHDQKPFWDYTSFINSIKWMNSHKDTRFHNFCSENKYELAAFLANTHQETGDPSLKIPYPWLYPPAQPKTGPEYSEAGGLLAIMEGCSAMISPHPPNTPVPFTGDLNTTAALSQNTRNLIGLNSTDILSVCVMNLNGINQPNFGLGTGTGGGVVFQNGLAGVSDNGTLYGDAHSESDTILPSKQCISSTTDPRYAALGPYAQYGGRGAIQLSYNFNYTSCSLELFGDYRLVRYPNLLITTDRINLNGKPYYFGFPGPNLKGNNTLPKNIADTTPPARMMAWISAICFWMLPRSGKNISCHQCMLEPSKYGITSVNMIVNNQSGCTAGTWAANKNKYYTRICNIFGIDPLPTIICPAQI